MSENYKTVCDKCYQGTWYETEQPCQRTISKGCPTCGSHEFVSKQVKCTGTLRVISNENLDERLTPFYKSGERVEITYKNGEKKRCYIGKSTGWKPCYLEISRRDSSGGGSVYFPEDATIRGLGITRQLARVSQQWGTPWKPPNEGLGLFTTMKYIFWILFFITVFFLLAKLTNYQERMEQHNKYMCAVYGYYEDCKTPLKPEDRLK